MSTQKEDELERQRANMLKATKEVDWRLQAAVKEYQATNLKQKFDAAIKAGFSEPNALYLCTQVWPMS